MIKIDNVSKKYDEFVALEKVSLSINTGSIYGLIGSNGAGKSTLLKIISGVYTQDSGIIKIDDEDVFENINIKSKIAYIPDDLYFFSQYTIEHMAKFYKDIYSSFDNDRYNELKGVFNIDTKRKISSLSKGMKRQVSFWISLCIKPKYLILDEPLDGLDPVMRQKVKNLMIQDVVDNEMSIIISSHNLREIEDICDYIGILHKGKMVIQNDLDQLKSEIFKFQVVFKDDVNDSFYERLDVRNVKTIGSVKTFTIKGDKDFIIGEIQKEGTLILDILALTLEEIFIYEMGDVGYEISSIVYQ